MRGNELAPGHPEAPDSFEVQSITLAEVLRTFAFNCTSGALLVQTPAATGEVKLQRGIPLGATFGDQGSDDALLEMLALAEGSFELRIETVIGDTTLEHSLADLLAASQGVELIDVESTAAPPTS